MGEAERAFAAAWWLVDELARSGMRRACVSPGSRSTPLALALSRHPHVDLHVHLDERACAFFALGIAKGTGGLVGVACTSGTAVAELLPAVVEASMSRTRLALLTADRPPELRGVGANQAIDQPGIFGPYVKESIDAPVPGDAPQEDAWRALAARIARSSEGHPPGPVHVNLPYREPLVGAPLELPASSLPDRPAPPVADVDPEDVEALEGELTSTSRGLIVAGTIREGAAGLIGLAGRAGWPLIAEPTSGARVPGSLAAGQLLLEDPGFADAHVPDVVLQIGAAPTSRPGLELVGRAGRLVIVDPDRLVADPHRRAARTIRADPESLSRRLLEGAGPAETPWTRAWHDADSAARSAVDALLDEWDEPFEGRVARDVAASAPDGAVLVAGSSMPIRDLDAFMAPREGLRVLANRGASGIDGFVSTSLGIASAGIGPTIALMGDLTFLHDVGSLLWSARGTDAVLVVVNNAGGAIFGYLPQRDLPEFGSLFLAPHALDLGAVCEAAGARHVRVDGAGDLVPALSRAMEARGAGVGVIEVAIDRELDRRRHAEVRTAVGAAIG
jgi:2-succinyl-5-enolpyruvyl-6-hydroxy-3-cyclohexene-1-carboxylate synthase